ncbi:ribosome maturation factor RimM [Ruania alkalisoli]|uniref:ribosome maturation factor RimM n=1 Tax=Ruania alkalisoli TaxID=2779775 RepID=UPI001FE2B40F|nr:ribosome maturation factor RimM [Ruania alkalisoli]
MSSGIDDAPRLVRVATVGTAHGLRGDVRVTVHTDDPEGRFRVGSCLMTEPEDRGPLTVAAMRHQQQHWFLRFDGVNDRTAAEALRGLELYAAADVSEDEAWYPFQLEGLRAELPDGTALGVVAGVQHLPAHDLIVLVETSGARTLVPFVSEIVPEVDVPGGRIVLDPPSGMLADEDER